MDVDFEVGRRVTRGPNGECGFIHAVEKRRLVVVEVRWETTGVKQWLPASEVRHWDKLSEPIQAPPSNPKVVKQQENEVWKLNADLYKAKREYWEKKKVVGKYGDYIYSLSENHPSRSKSKMNKLFSKLNKRK